MEAAGPLGTPLGLAQRKRGLISNCFTIGYKVLITEPGSSGVLNKSLLSGLEIKESL